MVFLKKMARFKKLTQKCKKILNRTIAISTMLCYI